jgi:hypothetical protein
MAPTFAHAVATLMGKRMRRLPFNAAAIKQVWSCTKNPMKSLDLHIFSDVLAWKQAGHCGGNLEHSSASSAVVYLSAKADA